MAQDKFKDLKCLIEVIILSLVIIKLCNHIQPSYYYIVIMLNLVIIIIVINLHDLHNIYTLVQTAGINKFLRKKEMY